MTAIPTITTTMSSLPTPVIPQPSAGLTPQQLQDVAAARQRAGKLRRAVSVAKFDAWGVAIFGGLTLLGSLVSFSVIGTALGIGMAIVAYVEFKGIERLRQLDPTAANTLGRNQLFFGGLLLLYAIYSLFSIYHDNSPPFGGALSSADAAAIGLDVTSITRMAGWLVYGTLAFVAITVQGGTALYYFSRRRYIEQYASETPQWIIDAQRAGLPM